ncbi:alpha-amylase family glycosyl hydrolase [Marivirga harenae]|uniref:alpha-amylase family glycosyl hydrolase n=1 Tax=Marivirga harenae TaxID=2010992 RepID=UPI0026E0840F|nr:alpha-amylase family glycosyl hydrolase [Marivirga harenae]WKV13200.1 alpha-amylase family glycosyl hydrolase [Marivirga harenae]
MTILKTSLLILCLLTPEFLLAQSTNVEFQVNMNEQITQGNFDPNADFVDIAGSFNSWGDPGLVLSDDDSDGIYVAEATFSIGQQIELKARINGSWDGTEEFPGGGANRIFTIEENAVIAFWYNDEVPNDVLQVDISASSNFAIPGEVIQFIDLSNGSPVAWEWSFAGGNPSSSSEQNPIISYASEGSYDVSLTIENEEGESVTKTFENFITIGNTDTHWWNEMVFYEIFVRSFYDADGDGIGDFQGLIQKLDYLNDGNPTTHNDLGINGIWLMPIHQSPSYHGYDVTDYREIESDYGTNADFKEFIAEAHDRGIKVIIDYVMNHSSSEHPWFRDSKNPSNEKRDWYVWEENNPGGSGPWGQNVWHQSSGDYYYGLFWGGMPDLNYESPGVKEEMFDISTYWLEEMNVDGFRLDAVKYIYETEEGLEDVEETFQFWKDFRTHYKSINPNAFSVGEAWSSTNKAREYVGNDGLDYVFEFDLAGSILNAVNNGDSDGLISKTEEVMGSYPYLQFGTFLTNHDMNRVMNVLDEDVSKAKLGAELLLTLPGIPYLYYGEEIGMLGQKPDEDIRLPMQWSDATNAGFTTGSPWRAPKSDYPDKNIQGQQADHESLWRKYQELIATRNSQTALQTGNYSTVQTNSSDVFSFIRQKDEEQILVVSNLTNNETNNINLQLNSSNLMAGNYQLVDLLSGNQIAVTVSGIGGIDFNVERMDSRSTQIYKFLTTATATTDVEFMVDMNQLIAEEAFDSNAESVILISSENDFGSENLELSETEESGIYSIRLSDIRIGSSIEFKFGINNPENGREEFPDSDQYRFFRLKEGTNQVLNQYNQLGSSVTSNEEEIKPAQSLKIYPNPAQRNINVEIENPGFSASKYQIMDGKGSIKLEGKITNGHKQIDIHNLKEGLYFLQIIGDNKRMIHKLLVVD